MSHFDWLVVGAGLTGATFAERLASQADQKVLVIDKQLNVAGSAFDSPDEMGTLVHRHGPHVFHTNSDRVWDYVRQFAEWKRYDHEALISVDGQLLPFPFTLNTLDAIYPAAQSEELTAKLVYEYGDGAHVPILKLVKSTDPDLAALGAHIYDRFYLHYTEKQWGGLRPEDLDYAVTSRVPILVGRDPRYFYDAYQGLPVGGYTAMVERVLDHPNIRVALGTDYSTGANGVSWDHMLFTGPVDGFFGHRFGPLPYRSLEFCTEVFTGTYQPAAVITHPNEHFYTRVTEYKHFYGTSPAMSTVVFEYPRPYEPGVNEAYYPIPTPASRQLYKQYHELAKSLEPEVYFAGRAADYRYYNMDQAVSRALLLFDKVLQHA